MSLLQASAIAATSLAVLAGAARYAVKARSSRIFGPSVWKATGTRRSIALTFDDGPSPGTLDLLDYLEQQDIRATFFQCGANIQRHPAIALAVHRAGHEIGNHTHSHPRLCPRLGRDLNIRSAQEIFHEFACTQTLLRELGVRPKLLRAPYGMRWFGMREVQRKLGLLGVMWSVIGHDWEWNAEAIASFVLSKITPGAIVCLHDGRDTRPNPDIGPTLAALKILIPALKNQGYSFETVSDIIAPTSKGSL